jgi:hypothetical protein
MAQQTPSQDLRNQPTTNRTEEYTGLAQGIGLEAAKTGAELYAGKKLILDPLIKAFGNRGAPPPGPVAPVAPPVMAQPTAPVAPVEPMPRPVAPAGSPQATLDILKAQNPQAANAAAQQAAAAAQQQEAAQITRAKQMVRQMAMNKLMKATVGGALLTASPSLNANEDEELRRRRAMPPTITR